MKDKILVDKMIRYTSKVIGYCRGYTYDKFAASAMLVEACVFNLSQLGELCRLADDDLIMAHPEIPWREICGLRNRIVHDYEGVNLRLVWEIIRDDLPQLEKTLQAIQQDTK